MRVTTTDIPGVLLIEPDVSRDPRGLFLETYHARRYADAGIPGPFVQDNCSQSMRGTLRGLHYQEPHAQGKLMMVTEGIEDADGKYALLEGFAATAGATGTAVELLATGVVPAAGQAAMWFLT